MQCLTGVGGETCASTGTQCAQLTNDYRSLTQTKLTKSIQSTTVQLNGGVYYTDKSSIYYYVDDCTPEVSFSAR